MDFELNQSTTISSNGETPVRTAGDLLITYGLASGGTVPTLTYYTWLTSSTTPSQVAGRTASQVCAASTSFPCWGLGTALNVDGVHGPVNTVTVSDPIPAPGQTSAASLDLHAW